MTAARHSGYATYEAFSAEGNGDTVLKEFWLRKLLSSIFLTAIAGLDGSFVSLVVRAHRVLDVIVIIVLAHDIAAVFASGTLHRLRGIEDSILALTAQIATLATVQASNRPLRFTTSTSPITIVHRFTLAPA